ncbi:MAG: methionyl-tRNA formyltransferase [Gammaproteobacteria bacterium]
MRIVFAGTPEFAVPCLQSLLTAQYNVVAVYTQPDRPAGRGRKLTPSPVKRLAQNYDLPVYQPESLRSAEAQQILAQLKPDLMIVVAYGLLLPADILTIPTDGCINVHASLLPRWRGAAPIQHAILAGDNNTGVTIMQMAQGLDTGDMLYKVPCEIAEKNARELHDELAALGAQALLTVLGDWTYYQAQAQAQDDAQSCYASKIIKQDAQINWRQSADIIVRVIRAYNPWPVAFSHLNDLTIRIWCAHRLSDTDVAKLTQLADQQPGTIIHVSKQGIDVQTGDGVIRITSLQLPGSNIMSVQDVFNAKRDLFEQQCFLS